jgi:hypothetical protein
VAETNRSSAIETEAKQFIEENELLLDSGFGSTEAGTLATSEILGRIVVHGGEIANNLSAEIVYEIDERVRATNTVTDAIKDPHTSPARIKKLEDERTRIAISQESSTKQATFEQLSSLIERAIELRRGSSREASADEAMERVHVREVDEVPDNPEVAPRVPPGQGQKGQKSDIPDIPEEANPGFWNRLFGGM